MKLPLFTTGFPLLGGLGAGLARLAPNFFRQQADEPLSDYSTPPRLDAFLAYVRELEGSGTGDVPTVFHNQSCTQHGVRNHG
jgi:hypothetical protein